MTFVYLEELQKKNFEFSVNSLDMHACLHLTNVTRNSLF